MPNFMHTIDTVMQRLNKTPEGCWLWTLSLNHAGYGQIGFQRQKKLVHRLLYEHFVGPIPDGLVLDHLCRVRHCANPSHLEAVTQRENVLRSDGFAPRQAAQTHCLRGHLLSADNLLKARLRDGERGCKACHRDRERVRRGVAPRDPNFFSPAQ